MSMHLRGSRDMMGQEDEGWWKSRTGLEQKLIILSTILFIVTFSLTITVIVLKNQQKKETRGGTTISPINTTTGTAVTGEPTATESTTTTPETPGSSSESTTVPTGETTTVPSAESPSPSPPLSPSPSPSPDPSLTSEPTDSTTSKDEKTDGNHQSRMMQGPPHTIVERLLMVDGA